MVTLPIALRARAISARFTSAADRFRNQSNRSGILTADGVCILGLYLVNAAKQINIQAPPVRLGPKNTTAAAPGNTQSYSANFFTRSPRPGLITLEMSIVDFLSLPMPSKAPPQIVAEDDSAILVLNPEKLTGNRILHGDDEIYAYAFYFDPPPCRSVVFAGVGTRAEIDAIHQACQAKTYNWREISDDYASWWQRHDA